MDNTTQAMGLTSGQPTASPRKGKILVIDDDIMIRTLLLRLLKAEGYEVELAVDGQEGWDKIENGLSPDLCIIDLMMPRLDGFGLLEKLKGFSSKSGAIKAITCSGNERYQAAQLRALGSLAHLIKPLTRPKILSVVSDVLEGKPVES